MKIANRDAAAYVDNLRAFTGSHLRGYTNHADNYVVISYGWYPIFVYAGGQWYENKSKYSHSTAVHITKARPQVKNIKLVTTDELRRIADDITAKADKAG